MILHNFPNASLALKPAMDAQKPNLAPEFEGRAAPPPERVTVTLDIDADILAWLKAQPLDWQREINNAARFVMDMSSQPVPPVEVYDDAARWEIAGPRHRRNRHDPERKGLRRGPSAQGWADLASRETRTGQARRGLARSRCRRGRRCSACLFALTCT